MEQHINDQSLAARWGMSSRTLQRWRWQGKGPAYLKLGRHVVYRITDIEIWETKNLRSQDRGVADSGK